jgi:hypothetical protein
MKNIVKLTNAMLIMSSMWGAAYAASTASCDNDVYQMTVQINQYGSITSVDGRQMNQVLSPHQTGFKKCSADGYRSGYFVCTLRWEMGNWGDTLHC